MLSSMPSMTMTPASHVYSASGASLREYLREIGARLEHACISTCIHAYKPALGDDGVHAQPFLKLSLREKNLYHTS